MFAKKKKAHNVCFCIVSVSAVFSLIFFLFRFLFSSLFLSYLSISFVHLRSRKDKLTYSFLWFCIYNWIANESFDVVASCCCTTFVVVHSIHFYYFTFFSIIHCFAKIQRGKLKKQTKNMNNKTKIKTKWHTKKHWGKKSIRSNTLLRSGMRKKYSTNANNSNE